MERLPGRPILKERILGLGAVLVDAQSRLHDLDAEVLLRALDDEGPPLSRDAMTFDSYLGQLEARIEHGRLEGLRPAMSRLREQRPPEPALRAICHGDFHPQNILADGGSVTAVLDWPNALVADPAYDVASTRIILTLTPIALTGPPAALQWVAHVARIALAKRYLAGIRRRRPFDPAVLGYYEAASAMRALVRAAEYRRRRRTRRRIPSTPRRSRDNLAVHFARVTGVRPVLPPRRADPTEAPPGTSVLRGGPSDRSISRLEGTMATTRWLAAVLAGILAAGGATAGVGKPAEPDEAPLVKGNTEFAFDLYAAARPGRQCLQCMGEVTR